MTREGDTVVGLRQVHCRVTTLHGPTRSASLAHPTRAPRRPAEPGSKLGGFVVAAARAVDDAWAAAPDGRRVLLATGTSASLSTEAHALEVLRKTPGMPRALEQAPLPGGEALLAIEVAPQGALSLVETAERTDGATAIALLHQMLDVADALERAGLGWAPELEDAYVHDGRLGLHRVRGAARLAHRGRLDPRPVIDELGVPLVSDARLMLPGALLRVVLPSRDAGDEPRTIEAMRSALMAAEAALSIPADDAEGLATLGDLGLLRDKHEDAIEVARGADWACLVVCDGVSASYRSDIASALAVRTVRASLSMPAARLDPASSIREAIHDAHRAICDERASFHGLPAGTTIVAALVLRRRLTIGWVGDSRAYWLGAGGDSLLTRDHSWLNDVIASGALTLEEALASPHAHALTRCLGPLEGGDPDLHAEPDVVELDVTGPGTLILCSDGLWNYFPSAEELAALVARIGPSPRPAEIARGLVHAALSRGGQDNVSVAVFSVT